ncbi:hypothetical protein HMPREF3212_01836 [Citrobacter freundii]|uniref:Uncharacterized protein n=1 Tax=Citrobacter freundii TaxID=546 RepID=A0A133LIC4_CITFR|nr:hypothetical protein AB07_2924 [Citrobacter freundii]KWZ91641.1 hypothetical protein HMPREF3212_01836 [Citrobacter freundii]CDL39418.1 hypothetical protein [Citrobacter freundii]
MLKGEDKSNPFIVPGPYSMKRKSLLHGNCYRIHHQKLAVNKQ